MSPPPAAPGDRFQFSGAPLAPPPEPQAEAPLTTPTPPVAPAPPAAAPVQHQGIEVRTTSWGALVMEDPSMSAFTVPVGTTRAFSEKSREGLQLPVQSAVVIGGGPGGLAAAIKMAEKGVKVTVVEVRNADYQRPHHLNARLSTLEGLMEYGVYAEVQAASGWGDEVSPVRRRGLHGEAERLIRSDSVAQIRISDVEKALHSRAMELGIDFQAHHRAHLGEPDDQGLRPVSIEPVTFTDGKLVSQGPARALGTPDLVVVADGAGSPTRASLGIEFLEESQPRVYLGGQVNKPLSRGDGGYEKLACYEGEELRHYMATGHKKYPQTWVSVEADSSVRTMSVEERTHFLADRASAVMGQNIRPEDIGWGAGQITVVQNRRAESTTAGNNVVLIGDAVRTGSVWQSGGLNLALTGDVHNLMRLIDGINDQGQSREHALKAYNLRAQAATSAWHKAGENELNGVEPAPSGKVGVATRVPDVHPVRLKGYG